MNYRYTNKILIVNTPIKYMTPNLFNLTAIAFYIITWVLIVRCVQVNIKHPEEQPQVSKVYFIAWAIALVAHLLSIITPLTNSEELSFSFVALGSYVAGVC